MLNKILKLNKIQNIFMKKNIIGIRGIAMVESLMAITIIIISIMGPIAISLNAAKYAKYGLYKVTASSLANEQIEMMLNYKKSLDIYCFNNVGVSGCTEDGFDIFVNNFTDPSPTSINCSLSNSADPCYFDDTSFIYPVSQIPEVSEKSSCKLMIQSDDIAKCDDGGSVILGESSVFTRKLYIDNVDPMEDTNNSLISTSVRLVSLVCINNDSCVPGDKRAITIISYIYR